MKRKIHEEKKRQRKSIKIRNNRKMEIGKENKSSPVS